jgi:hypothetical protein
MLMTPWAIHFARQGLRVGRRVLPGPNWRCVLAGTSLVGIRARARSPTARCGWHWQSLRSFPRRMTDILQSPASQLRPGMLDALKARMCKLPASIFSNVAHAASALSAMQHDGRGRAMQHDAFMLGARCTACAGVRSWRLLVWRHGWQGAFRVPLHRCQTMKGST